MLWATAAAWGAPQADQAPAQGPPGEAQGPPVVALLPFTGAEAAVPPRKPLHPEATARAVRDLLRERAGATYKVLPVSEWTDAARRHFSGKTTELQGIARVLKADLLVGGWLEATPGSDSGKPYRLTVALYNNWAEPLGQVAIDLDTPQAEAARLGDQAGALLAMVDHALGLAPPAQAPPQAQGPGVVRQADDQEVAPLPEQRPVRGPGSGVPLVPPTPEARELYYMRAPWRQVFDVRAGYLYNLRHFTDNGSGRAFNTSGASGLYLHGEVYPLAAVRAAPLAAAGLGFRLTAMLPFWPEVKQENPAGQETGAYSAKEYRVEVGWLRWHWNFLNRTLAPDITVEGLYGYHSFALAPLRNVAVLDIPSTTYSYLGASIGSRFYLVRRLWAQIGFAFAGMLGMGPITDPGAPGNDPIQAGRAYHTYGPGSGWLWRLDFALAVRAWRGLTVGLGFYYEQNLLSFLGQGDVLLIQQVPGGPPQKATAATDEYGGIYFNLGYVY